MADLSRSSTALTASPFAAAREGFHPTGGPAIAEFIDVELYGGSSTPTTENHE
jgi:hypothetical protein